MDSDDFMGLNVFLTALFLVFAILFTVICYLTQPARRGMVYQVIIHATANVVFARYRKCVTGPKTRLSD